MSGNVNVSAIFHDYSETWVNFANTGAEDGSLARPFNTIHEGVGAVLGGGTVRILSGSTASAIRITKPMRIESSGGTATIGR